MSHTKVYTLRKGFSLIELLIVIFMVSLIYAMGFSGIDLGKSEPKPLSPLNLKDNIIKSGFYNGRTTLMFTDKCKKCYLRRGLVSTFTPYSQAIKLNNLKAYTLDNRESLREIEYDRFNDHNICLVIDFYNNGSSTQLILEDDEGAYFLPAFFGEAKKFNSVDDAKRHWIKLTQSISSSGEYY